MFEIIKSTLAEVNNGVCQSRNNANYKGKSAVWVVVDVTEENEAVAQFKTKKKATEFLNWLIDSGIDYKKCDVETEFENVK